MTGHNVTLSAAANNDDTADLIVDCTCRTAALYDGPGLSWPEVSQLVADHLAA